MGLDQYGGTIETKVFDYDDSNEEYQIASPFEWRKHARLQEFMNRLYMEKNSVEHKWESSIDDNGKKWINPISWDQMELTKKDVDKLDEAIQNGYRDYFCDGGFFWGHGFQEEAAADYKEQDKEFVAYAKKALKDKKKVFYECSW